LGSGGGAASFDFGVGADTGDAGAVAWAGGCTGVGKRRSSIGSSSFSFQGAVMLGKPAIWPLMTMLNSRACIKEETSTQVLILQRSRSM
jgi:hypothetical protein